jgi:hypothetical protein
VCNVAGVLCVIVCSWDGRAVVLACLWDCNALPCLRAGGEC